MVGAMVNHASDLDTFGETLDAQIKVLANCAFDANNVRDIDTTIVTMVLNSLRLCTNKRGTIVKEGQRTQR
jgi:hypothetical protein